MDIREILDRIAPESEAVDLFDLLTPEEKEENRIIAEFITRRKEVLKAESTPVGRNIYDAFAERREPMDDLISRISLKQSIVVSAILEDKKTLEQIIDEEPSIDAVPRQKYEEDMENAFSHGYTDAESNFRKMIADGELVEVVRCRECKECEIIDEDDYWCKGRKVWEDHYCAYGERRTDEQN